MIKKGFFCMLSGILQNISPVHEGISPVSREGRGEGKRMDSRVGASKKRADRAEGKGPGATQRGEEGAASGVNMPETVEGQRKKQSVGAVFARE